MPTYKLLIKYNYQNDNDSFDKLKSTAQCGYTSACMLLSTHIAEAVNDWYVKEFIMYMDKDFLTGKSGTRKGAMQANYKPVLDYYLKKSNVPYQAAVIPQGGTVDNIVNSLHNGSPLMLSTMMTTSGHYICIVGIDTERRVLICHDPYGKFDFVKKKYIVNSTI